MLLAIDIGNTNIVVGLFQDRQLSQHWKIMSDREKTCDEYAVTLLNLFSINDLNASSVDSVILSSVVPPLTPVFQDLSKALFQIKPLVVVPVFRVIFPRRPKSVIGVTFIKNMWGMNSFSYPMHFKT